MRRLPIVLALLAAAAFGGFAATALRDAVDQPARATPALPAAGALPAEVGGRALPSLAPMLQDVTPAVVSVHSTQRVRIHNPFFDDPIFRRMFPGLPQERIRQSLGSGVIVDAENGYVLTNHHVIEGADAVQVTLSDGRTVEAEFIGSDPDTDVALMRIPAEGLSEVTLADSSELQVGDFVVAVGNPFGIGQTVTSGIVSAVGRTGLAGLGFQDFIQTDASINPGNSGGALVNLQGELVGINTASFNPRGSMAGNIGLGFAIPTNLARGIMEQLIANDGVVRRGVLGVETQAIDARMAETLGLQATRGALVTRVYPDSAAADAGVQPGDVVVGANGERIDGPAALHNFEGLQPIGSAVVLDVRRDDETLRLETRLREQPRTHAGSLLDPRLSGAVFAELPERLRQAGIAGVLVETLEPGSRAARNGLREGDLVVATGSGRFEDLAGFRASVVAADPRATRLVLQVVRGDTAGTLAMQ
ncbi:MAG TPA: trypsin-like peptidase domain-containing protein [Xanthomonadaceae bacterium]|nr:trypsin-like peptidase domain-containing protein [Xanthomonadaceae bacterium]